jgi:hypothetical protein
VRRPQPDYQEPGVQQRGFDFCIVAASRNRERDNEGAVFDLACPVPPQCDNLAPKMGDPGDAE